MSDMVNHPPHYTSHPSGVECITITEHMTFSVGNAIKYLWRADRKNGVEDLRKAAWYIEREIQRLTSEPAVPLVRPPAPSVPDPPVELPKREQRPRRIETRPKPTEVRPAAGRGGHREAKYDYAEVARVANAAVAAGRPMQEAVMERWSVTAGAAKNAVKEARRRGHGIVGSRGPKPIGPDVAPAPVESTAPAERVLACDECDFEVAAGDGAKREMSQHAIGTHRRAPKHDEMLPVPKGVAA